MVSLWSLRLSGVSVVCWRGLRGVGMEGEVGEGSGMRDEAASCPGELQRGGDQVISLCKLMCFFLL